jgi:hypothetical protein
MYKVVYDNSNYFKSIVIDVIRMNQSDVGECSIVDEEPNVNVISFFIF